MKYKSCNLYRSLLYVVLIFYCFSSYAQTKIEPLFPCSQEIQNSYGVNCHLSYGDDFTRRDGELRLMKKIGINIVRGGAHFHTLGFHHGQFNPSMMDSIMYSIEKSHIPMSGNLSLDSFGKYCWEDKESYAQYVDYISERYNYKIQYWEVANEVDLAMKFNDAPYKYSEVLKHVYPFFKNKKKNNEVLVSGISSLGLAFFDSICSYRAFDYFDIMNFHSYNTPEDLPIHFRALRAIMDKYNFSKELWLGECGMHTAPKATTTNETKDRNFLEKEQAQRLPRIYLISFAYGVNKVFWYEIRSVERDVYEREHHFGLLHADLTPKPAFYAFASLIKFCPDRSSRPELTQKGDDYLAHWRTPKGIDVWAAWSIGKSAPTLSVKGNAKFYDIYGVRQKKCPQISESVTYIVGAKKVSFKLL